VLGIGLIGCGAIGSTIVEAILLEEIPDVRLVGVLSRSTNEVIQRVQQLVGA